MVVDSRTDGYVCPTLSSSPIKDAARGQRQVSAFERSAVESTPVDDAHVGHSFCLNSGHRMENDVRGTCGKVASGELSLRYPSPSSEDENDTLRLQVKALDAKSPASSQFVGRDRSHASLNGSCAIIEIRLPTPPSDESSSSSLPSLFKETVRQYSYVDSLVDVATTITNTLWPCREHKSTQKQEDTARSVSYFITETSRKSKTSLSTMQLALLYCIRFKRDQEMLSRALVDLNLKRASGTEVVSTSVGSTCPRRNFLSALILASKYLQDRNFSNKAWSKISSVTVSEINLREREFLEITKWNLDVKHDVFKDWSSMMETFIIEARDVAIFGDLQSCQTRWRCVVRSMTRSTDSAMRETMAQYAMSESCAIEQLLTPASTPIAESPEFVLPTLNDESSSLSSAIVAPVLTDIASSSSKGTLPCPFFDEFIKSTPWEHATHVSVKESSQGPEAGYATPESFSTESPDFVGHVTDSGLEPLMGPQADASTHMLTGIKTSDLCLTAPATPELGVCSSFSLATDDEMSCFRQKRSAAARVEERAGPRKRVRTVF